MGLSPVLQHFRSLLLSLPWGRRPVPIFGWPPGARGRAVRRAARPRPGRCASPVDRLLALVVARQQSARAAGQIGRVRAPLNQDQVKAGRSRSQRFWSAATRALRLLISSAMVAAETILCHGADPIPADPAIHPRSPVGAAALAENIWAGSP